MLLKKLKRGLKRHINNINIIVKKVKERIMIDELYTKEQVEETIKKIKDEIYHLAFRVYEGREMLDRKEILVNIDNYITKNLSLRGFEKVTQKVNEEEAI